MRSGEPARPALERRRRAAARPDALDTLEHATDELTRHGASEDVTFRYLSQSLESDAHAIEQRLAQGRYEGAAYLTQRLTETCVACHVRLPAKTRRGFAGQLLERVDREDLTPLARAKLETATREFDAALRTYEGQFADPQVPAASLESSGAVYSYLIVALRVRRDAERARKGLALLAERSDLPDELAGNLETWRASLQELAPALAEPPSLERASNLLDEGRRLIEPPAGGISREGADRIHAIIASSLLYRYLEENAPSGTPLALALYLLGRTEAFTRTSFELSEAEYYFEEAIRSAPHTPVAAQAFAALEKETVLGYTGSSGEQIPDDVRARLEQLRALSRLESAKGSPKEPGAPRKRPPRTREPSKGTQGV